MVHAVTPTLPRRTRTSSIYPRSLECSSAACGVNILIGASFLRFSNHTALSKCVYRRNRRVATKSMRHTMVHMCVSTGRRHCNCAAGSGASHTGQRCPWRWLCRCTVGIRSRCTDNTPCAHAAHAGAWLPREGAPRLCFATWTNVRYGP